MMAFFRSVYLLFQKVFGLSVSKGSEFSTSDPLTMPAFVPAMPKPVKLDVHFKPQRPKDALAGLECTQVGGVVVISCGDRRHYRFSSTNNAGTRRCMMWSGLQYPRACLWPPPSLPRRRPRAPCQSPSRRTLLPP